MKHGAIALVIALAVLISLLDASDSISYYNLTQMVRNAKPVFTKYLPFTRADLLTYEKNPKERLTTKSEIPCPVPANITVICNTHSDKPCICVNTISPEYIVMNPGYYCTEDAFRHVHYIRVDLNVTATRKYCNGTEETVLMSPEEMEGKLLHVFNQNRFNPNSRKKTISEIDDISIIRLTCDFDYYLTLYMAIKADKHTTSENNNLTIADVGFDEKGILNTTLLQIDRIRSVNKTTLPYTEIKPVLILPTIVSNETISDDVCVGPVCVPHRVFGTGRSIVVVVVLLSISSCLAKHVPLF
uniref:DUF1619 domain-containing protein n=1 Tax=Panagrellus redivivus TaxID=6233 RepID=A0A7E4ZU58_PANRE